MFPGSLLALLCACPPPGCFLFYYYYYYLHGGLPACLSPACCLRMPNIDACLHGDHMAELPVQRSNQTQAVLQDIENGVQAEWQRLKRSPVWLPNPLPLELFSNVLGGKLERGFWSIRQCTGYHGFYEASSG